MAHVERASCAIGLTLFILAAACGSDDGDTSTGAGGDGGSTTSTGAGGTGGTGGTGGSSDTGGTGGTGGDAGGGGGATCGAIGSPCSGTCPDGLTCYQDGGFCIPAGADCGGFAGAECPSDQVCMILSGADFGPCGSQMVKDCVCSQSPGALGDCP